MSVPTAAAARRKQQPTNTKNVLHMKPKPHAGATNDAETLDAIRNPKLKTVTKTLFAELEVANIEGMSDEQFNTLKKCIANILTGLNTISKRRSGGVA